MIKLKIVVLALTKYIESNEDSEVEMKVKQSNPVLLKDTSLNHIKLTDKERNNDEYKESESSEEDEKEGGEESVKREEINENTPLESMIDSDKDEKEEVKDENLTGSHHSMKENSKNQENNPKIESQSEEESGETEEEEESEEEQTKNSKQEKSLKDNFTSIKIKGNREISSQNSASSKEIEYCDFTKDSSFQKDVFLACTLKTMEDLERVKFILLEYCEKLL